MAVQVIARCPIPPPEPAMLLTPWPCPALARRMSETGMTNKAVRDLLFNPMLLKAVMDGSHLLMTVNGHTAMAKPTEGFVKMMAAINSFRFPFTNPIDDGG